MQAVSLEVATVECARALYQLWILTVSSLGVELVLQTVVLCTFETLCSSVVTSHRWLKNIILKRKTSLVKYNAKITVPSPNRDVLGA